MSIRINNLSLSIDEDKSSLVNKVAKKLRLPKEEVKNIKIIKESLDARKKNSIKYIYCVEVEHKNEEKIVNKLKDKDVRLESPSYNAEIPFGDKELKNRPV